MQIAKNKTKAIAIAIFLTISMGVALIPLQTVSAHTPAWSIPTFAYIVVSPNPVGVGQSVIVLMWVDKPIDSALLVNDIRMTNYKLTITKPNQENETKEWPIVVDSTSSQYLKYTPDQVGTYTFKFEHLGTKYTWSGAYQNDTYMSSSATTTLTVQQEPLPEPINSYPLPSGYWTRPIYGENTDWWSISSNWLGTGSPVLSATGYGVLSGFGGQSAIQRYPGDAIGPSTAHVIWTKPIQPGGVVGGNDFAIQGDTYYEGTAYNQRFTNPIILNGRLYYNPPVAFTGTNSGPTTCVDLRTGEVIWQRTDVDRPSFGYICALHDPNHHGVQPAVLFTSNFARAFDADTGDPLFNVTGVPSGAIVMGPQGEHLRYVMTNLGNSTNPDYRLAEWNSSKLWVYTSRSPVADTSTTTTTTNVSSTTYVNGVKTTTLTPTTTTTRFVNASIFNSTSSSNRYDWNVTIPWLNTMTTPPPYPGGNPVTVMAAFYNNVMICRNGSLPTFSTQTPYTYFAVNLNASKGIVGSVLWWNTLNPAPGNVTLSNGGADPTVGVFTESYKETMQWVGYSMTTGQKIWGPTASQTALDYYGNPMYPYVCGQVAYGKLYSSAYGGILYCYNLTTGNLLWTYGNGGPGNSTNSGFYNGQPNYPTYINAVGDGKIYTVATEHTIQTPIYKGALARCINASNGAEIWTLSDYTSEFSAMSYAIADGFAIFLNCYDSQIYSVGRGPSATTVTASPKVSTHGGNVLIEGSVMDISAGTKQNQQAADFPNGVACASDASMKDWMGYVYQQKPLPTNFAGVQVTIDVLDSNFNYRTIGSATIDASGKYSLTWTPDIAGNYTIIANFAGTNGYWPSYSENSFNVMEAPPATPSPTPAAPLPPYEMYTIGAAIAIIIAVAIVGLILLRKRP